MKIICDCGTEVFQIKVERLGTHANGQMITKSVGVHVDVRPGPPAVLFTVSCEMCGRIAIEVSRSDSAPVEPRHQPATDLGELN